jgi:hypothetical protein
MADNTNKNTDEKQPLQGTSDTTPEQQAAQDASKLNPQQRQAAYAASADQANRVPRDETEPGGHYVVNGRHVNAVGDPYGTPLQGREDEQTLPVRGLNPTPVERKI